MSIQLRWWLYPEVADIHELLGAVRGPVYAQHVDGVGYGGFTGHVTAASLKTNGASGSHQPF